MRSQAKNDWIEEAMSRELPLCLMRWPARLPRGIVQQPAIPRLDLTGDFSGRGKRHTECACLLKGPLGWHNLLPILTGEKNLSKERTSRRVNSLEFVTNGPFATAIGNYVQGRHRGDALQLEGCDIGERP